MHLDVELLERRCTMGWRKARWEADESREEGSCGGLGSRRLGERGHLGEGFLPPRAARITSQPLGCGNLLPAQSHPSHASTTLPGH